MHYHGIILTDTRNLYRLRPFGSYILANVLRENGYRILVIDHFSSFDDKQLKTLLTNTISSQTIFVGYGSTMFVTSSSSDFLPVGIEKFKKINQVIKDINPNTKIIFGGANSKTISSYNLLHKDNLGVDYVFHGYAEAMVLDFIKNIELGLPQKIKFKFNNLSEIDYDYKGELFNFQDTKHIWNEEDFIFQNETLPLEVARGCIFKCKFCSYPLLGKHIKDNGYIKLENNILEEVLTNYEKYQTTNYVIVDDTFNERTDKIELMLRVRDKSKLDLSFFGYNRLDLIARKPEQLGLLKDLSFKGMFFGIESLNYQSAKAIGKGLRPEEIEETLHLIKDRFNNKVSITGGFIIGLPHETKETFFKWFEKITSTDFPMDSYNISPLTMFIGANTTSEFQTNPEKYGYKIVNGQSSASNYWSNEHWDFNICKSIKEMVLKQIYNNGRMRLNSFEIASLASYGYNIDDLIASPKNKFNDSFRMSLQNVKASQYIESMLERSCSIKALHFLGKDETLDRYQPGAPKTT